MTLTLEQWLKAEGDGARHRLHLKTELSLPVIARACKGRASLSSALQLHLATGRKVRISSMTADLVPEFLEPAVRKRGARR